MWYRSTKTNKIIYSSASGIVDNVFGEGTFFDLIQNGTLTPISNPSVIDVLRDGDSTVLAIIRYRQIHGCDIREAREGVKMLKRDMAIAKNGKKGDQWKKEESVEPVTTPTSQDTDKSSATGETAGNPSEPAVSGGEEEKEELRKNKDDAEPEKTDEGVEEA